MLSMKWERFADSAFCREVADRKEEEKCTRTVTGRKELGVKVLGGAMFRAASDGKRS